MLLLAVGAAAAASPVVPSWVLAVDADTVQMHDGVVAAAGDVAVQLVGQRCTAQSLRYDRAAQVLELVSGACVDANGPTYFSRAELDLTGGTGVLFSARMEQHPGPFVVTADRVEQLEPGRLVAEDAWLSLCSCPEGPWSVEARQVDVVLDDVARFRGGWIQVCNQRVLPVPVGAIPLADRRTGLLLPRAGWGRDGLVAGVPAMLKLGRSADLVVQPEWRQERGFRGVGEARLALAPRQAVTAAGFGGWDTTVGAARGAVTVKEGWTPGLVRTAIDGQWVSDGAVLRDYGDDFLARSAPWSESRALVGVGPLRLETDRFSPLDDDPLSARPWSLVAAQGGVLVGPAVIGGTLRADGMADDAAGLATRASGQRLRGALGATVAESLGPTRWSAQLGGRVVQWDDQPSTIEGRAGASALLDLWGDVGAMRHVAAVGVAGGLAGYSGPSAVRLPDEAHAPTWRAGPVVESRWLSAGGIPVSMRLAAPWTPDGLRPVGRVGVQLGAWGGSAQGDQDLQDARVAWDDGVIRVGVGAVHTSPLLQGVAEASWRLPGVLAELRPGWRALYDFNGGSTLSQSALLTWQSRCDCLTAAAGATWSADRSVPDLLLRVEL